jgi:hypothetical protein
MHTALPLTSTLLWIRFALGAIALVWLPGHLLAGRWLREQDALSRCVVSISVGLVLPFVYFALAGRLGLPFRPLYYLPVVLILGGLSSLWSAYRLAIANWSENLGALGRVEGMAAASAVLLSFLLLLAGFSQMPAPPHIHDASNHAWLTLRIVETASLDAARINGDLAGRVGVGYLPGLHASAALIARLCRVAPYVSVWMLTLLLCAMIPAAWSLLWRGWGVPPLALSLALLLCAANPLGPGGILGWGGFGQIAGFFLVPVGALAVRSVWRKPSVPSGLVAGIFLGGLVFLHASEVGVALGAALLCLDGRIHRHLRGGLVMLAAILVLCGPEVWHVATDYPRAIASEPPLRKEFLDSLTRLWRAGGRGIVFQVLLPAAWILGLRTAWARRLALTSLVLGAFYLLLQTLADPFTRLLATPFYRQAPRILYLQFYFLPPLLALPLTKILRRARAGSKANAGFIFKTSFLRGLVGGLLLAALVPGLTRVLENYRSCRSLVPFTVDDYRHAQALRALVPDGAMVANLWDDGSVWAMHVSERPFLQPCAWPLISPSGKSLHELSRGLADDPWPQETVRLLQRLRIHYLYVSDGVWGKGSGLRRKDFDDDARYQILLAGSHSTLYAIRGAPNPPFYPPFSSSSLATGAFRLAR